MENLDGLKTDGGFFKHVFRFDQDAKFEMLNIIQYAILAIIPVVILNKFTQRYIPEADEEKSSIELSIEIIAQVTTMLLVMLVIHRIITFIPTYSGEKYAELQLTNVVLAMLVIILSLQTKLGEKVSILVERAVEMWEGKKQKVMQGQNNNGIIKVSQPISQPTTGTTSIQSLPSVDYDQMYQQDQSNTNTGNASTGGGIESFGGGAGGIMAANDMIGSTFGSMW
jgi:hypothetical protein